MGLAGRKIKQRIGADPRNLTWVDDASRFGSTYLAKFGWDSSKGLGVEGDGRTSHIKASQKLDMLGIGAENMRDPNGIAWKQNRDFENLLRRLNESADGEKEEDAGTKVEGFVSEGKGDKKEVVEKSEKKRKRKEKRRAEETNEDEGSKKKRKNESPTPVPPVIPRHRAHRARAIAAKKMLSGSSTAISEILGIAPTTSSTPSETTTPDEETTKITTSTKSVSDYFKEKLISRSTSTNNLERGGIGSSRIRVN